MAILVGSGLGWADSHSVLSPEKQIPILLKVLTFDRAFEDRASDTLRIGVLFCKEHPVSRETADEVQQVLQSFSEKTVRGVPIESFLVEFTSREALRDELLGSKIRVLYLAPGLEERLEAVIDLTRELDVLTMTGVEDYIRNGISVGVRPSAHKPLLVNLEATRAEGAALDSRLLKMSEVLQ